MPCRLARLIVAQLQDQSKNPETVTDTLMIYWIVGSYQSKAKDPGAGHSLVYSRQEVRHCSSLHYLGEKEAAIYRGH